MTSSTGQPADNQQAGSVDNAAPPKRARKRAPKAASKKPSPKATARHRPQTVNVRPGTKTATILKLLHRPAGATLEELMKATAWQPHSVRGFLSGVLAKKMGLPVESFRRDDDRRAYRVCSR